jgi:hypothetical protein
MNLNADPNYPIVDGFTLNTNLRCNLRFQALALQRFEAMRRSGGMRSKYWVTPQNSYLSIPAYDAFEESIAIVPGSIIWGIIFVNSVVEGVVNSGPFSFQITESCTDVPLFSEVVRTDLYEASDGIEARNGQKILARPLIISEPGQLNVQICSQQSTAALGVQVILCGGEPS